MNAFIEWCNANQGFVSAILAFMSIILSVIAIIVSIIVANLPFRKKLAVAFYANIGVGLSDDIKFYSVEATNIGNRVIKVSFVGVAYKEKGWKKVYSRYNAIAGNVMLDLDESVSSQYDIGELDRLAENKTLYAIAIDVEGKMYKKRIK